MSLNFARILPTKEQAGLLEQNKKKWVEPLGVCTQAIFNLLDASSMANDTSVGLQCSLVIL